MNEWLVIVSVTVFFGTILWVAVDAVRHSKDK
jgi:hypothetical protein